MNIRTMLCKFFRGQGGTISAEAAIIFPVLAWGYLGLFAMFDAFRSQNINVRASYTIGDMLSREEDYVTPTYLTGLNTVQSLLTQSDYRTVLRVSVVMYDQAADKNILVWSKSTPGKPDLTSTTMANILTHVPAMGDGDSIIVVETWMGFVPLVNIGLDSFYFENVVVTRPRLAPQLKWSDT